MTDWIHDWVKNYRDGVMLIFKLKVFDSILDSLIGTWCIVLNLDDPTLSEVMSQWDLIVGIGHRIDHMQDG